MTTAKNRALPVKESALFKTVLKQFETKQYKKGLKTADQILKRFPEHGETLAMKGLFYNSMDKKEEGFELVKKGLRLDLTSHICWHVFGLLYRSDKNYEEAIKCYRNALRYDKDNFQILRDYALLQIQLRNYEALRESRHTLLQLNPRLRQNWVGLAMSYHLLGDYTMAESVLSSFEGTLKEAPKPDDYEHSEMLLYHNLILEESGDIQKALDHLEIVSRKTCDNSYVREKKAEYLSKLGRTEEAEFAWRNLIHENSENRPYFAGLQAVKGLTTIGDEASEKKVLALYDELAAKYPRSNAIQRLPLKFATGDEFSKRAESYLILKLRKGVPSLFNDVKSLYTAKEKMNEIQKIVETLVATISKHPVTNGHIATATDDEPPTVYLWGLYFLAQHYDHIGQPDLALHTIEKAIEHTPTLVELYMTKARILKHVGDYPTASKSMNKARELDLQDRFINSKCAKYQMRDDAIEDAEKTMSLFTRIDAPSPLSDLVDMQALWVLNEEASSFYRQGKLGLALQRLHTIEKHFVEFTEDQFDFHTYCLRKNTLRAYLRMLRFEDQLRSHPFFIRGALLAVKIYVRLFDEPQLADGINDPNFANLSEAEQKKARKKARKAELKSLQQDSRPDAQKKEEKVKDSKKKDDDPEGLKLVKTTDPMGNAMQFIVPCLEMASDNIDVQHIAFEVSIRRRKHLLALKALLKAKALDDGHPKLVYHIVHFIHEGLSVGMHSTVKRVIEEEIEHLTPKEKTLEEFITSNVKISVDHAINGAKALLVIDKNAGSKAAKIVESIEEDVYAPTRTLTNIIEAHQLLQRLKYEKLQDFEKKCKSWYPRASYFKTLDN